MRNEKYVGMDVHQASIVVAVLNDQGHSVMESIIATDAATISNRLFTVRQRAYQISP